MELATLLKSLENFSTEKLKVSVAKTGIVYKKYPKPPYSTDIFLIRDKETNTQYEIYAIDINNEYQIVELIKISGDRISSSVEKDSTYKEIEQEISKLLTNIS